MNLLDSDEPSVRWKFRVGVRDEFAASPAIWRLRQEIRVSPRVKALKAGLKLPRVYAKWQGPHWVLFTLAEIGHPSGDASLKAACDRVLDCWLDPLYFREFDASTKAASCRKEGVPVLQGRHRRCASQQGTALWSILTLGLADDRVDRLVERLLHWQWPDGGWNCDKTPSADTSSFVETLWPIRGLALYARQRRSAAARRAVERAAEVLLERGLFKRRRDGKVIHADFTTLHYPTYWHYDILAGLKVMSEAGFIRDPRCKDALDLLESKRGTDGWWKAGRRYYRRSGRIALGNDFVDWSGPEWVTVEALAVLHAAGRA